MSHNNHWVFDTHRQQLQRQKNKTDTEDNWSDSHTKPSATAKSVNGLAKRKGQTDGDAASDS